MITVYEYNAAGQLVRSYTVPDTSLRTAALAAQARNQTFLDLASPTNAQTLAQVKALTRQVNAIITALGNADLA